MLNLLRTSNRTVWAAFVATLVTTVFALSTQVHAQTINTRRVGHLERNDGRPGLPTISSVTVIPRGVVLVVRLDREFAGPSPTIRLIRNVIFIQADGAQPPSCGLSFANFHDVYEIRITGLAPGTYTVNNGISPQTVTIPS